MKLFNVVSELIMLKVMPHKIYKLFINIASVQILYHMNILDFAA